MKDIKMRTLVKYPFLGSVIAGVPLLEEKSIKTACTDGKSIYINPDFYNKLSKGEQVFLYAHEVLHIAFDHISRLKDKEPKLWNIATDAVINGLLKEDGLPLINGGIEMIGASGKTAEMVYYELLKEIREKQQNNNSKNQKQGQNNQNGKGQGQGQEKNDQNGNGQGQGQSEDQQNKDTQNGNSGNSGEEQDSDVGHASHKMWKDAMKTEQDIIDAKAFAATVERAAKMAGKSTSSVQKAFAELIQQKPIVDWKYLLRQSIKQNIDWSYQNAEFENNILQPRLEKKPHFETEIVIDTSGSIPDWLIYSFLSEVMNILKISNVKAGCFDTKFYGFEKIEAKNINNFKIIGRGGTDFDAAVGAFSKGAINRIILTDGYADMPRKQLKAIWLVVGQNHIEPKGGRVIHISEEQLLKIHPIKNNENGLSK